MTLQFIICNDPDDPKSLSNQRAVKSQAARHHWAQDAALRASKSKRRHRAQKTRLYVREKERQPSELPGREEPLWVQCHPYQFLGAGRVDPFHTYPVAWQPYFPEIIDHYIVNMAVDIAEIDAPGNKGLLRTRWFPHAMTDPATFLSILLLSASNLYSIQRRPNVAVDLLGLKQQVIQFITDGLADPERAYSDALVGAVAKMCSYEAMYGTAETYAIHMKGLRQMVAARGGLSKLGLDGLLRRICLWIDLNSAFLIGSPRFFQDPTTNGRPLLIEPNPSQFIGCQT